MPSPEHLNQLGIELIQQGQLAEAAGFFERAVQDAPEFAEAFQNLGTARALLGCLEQATVCYRRALQLKPDFADAYGNLGNALFSQGKLDEAVACYQRALELKPDFAAAHSNLGKTLFELGKLDEAALCYGRALELKPDYAESHRNLGAVFHAQGSLDEAIGCYQQALELRPDHAEACSNLGTAYKDQGRLDDAIDCFRQALEIKPEYVEAQSDLLLTLNYCPGYDAKTICEEHRRWSRQHCDPLAHCIPPHTNDRSAARRLRIGWVSPDFRDHPVALFLLPLLRELDREQFEVVCYFLGTRRDGVTDRIAAHADTWRNVAELTDEALAQCIRDDRIDILVDLAQHTGGNRLRVFARKPAPVQVSYLGYCGTTGISAIDYRMTDPHLDPPGQDDRIYVERSFRLPQTYWCYQPPAEAPPVNDVPAQRPGYVTFACLNNFAKVTLPTLAAWRQLLLAVPDARLLLHAHRGSHRQRVLDLFAEKNIVPERVAFAGRLPADEYFRLYQQIDICLDPFPFGGGTTTCDALWMGVPVVTLAGRTAVGRAGCSILANVGLPELVARDVYGYVGRAVELAVDPGRLSLLRGTLRDRMRASRLMDAARFARDVEAAFREMWQRWCGA